MFKLIFWMYILVVVYNQFENIEAASSRSPNNENHVFVILENKDSRDSGKIMFPDLNEPNKNLATSGSDDRKTNDLWTDFNKRQHINTQVERKKNDERIWKNVISGENEDYIERNQNIENKEFGTIWSKTTTEKNSKNHNDRMIFEQIPTSANNFSPFSNKEVGLNPQDHGVRKIKTNSQSFHNQNTIDKHDSLLLTADIEEDRTRNDNKKTQSFAESQISENRVPASAKKQRQRLCEKKYSEYVRIIFPKDEDAANDADEVDFDGRLLAAPGEYPHMTALGFKTEYDKYDYKCGGSLISENFVISAAHCANVSGQAPSIARVGDLNLKIEEKYIDPETSHIKRIYVHPDYKEELYYNDIALIELSSSITFSVDVRPIRLWTRSDAPFPVVYAMGYGSTAFGKALTRQLTYLNLTIVPNNECKQTLPVMPEAPRGIIASQLCAFDYLMKRDTCQGDSGGPLQYTLKGRRQKNRRHYLLLGIISYGLYCRSNYPSVYTRISSYLDWIEQIVWS